MLTAVGLMSGTSADGVSVAAIRVEGQRLRLAAYRTFRYPKKLRGRVLAAGRGEAATGELSALHADLGSFFARSARAFIGRGRADVIGSHGQTVWHAPGLHTLQLGDAARIAVETGITTVCDFRAADVAAGGQGAPLVPYFDAFVFGGKTSVLLNLGGIANVTVTGPRKTIGFDTGPGNCLIDEAVRAAFGREFDRGGKIAASGRIDLRLLRRLELPYLRKAPPKSTGRELWSRALLLDRLGRELRRRPADVVATLTFLTARTVADAIARWGPPKIQEVIVSGGGVYNRALMGHLEWLLWPAVPRPIDVYGIHPLAKEPAAFALLAAEAVRGRSAAVGSATGAKGAPVLGKIVPGANYARLMRRLHR